MNKTILQTIALFCIELILILPIYSAVVFADISGIKAYGSDGIVDYIKTEDFITFEALISSIEEINPEQVTLGQNIIFNTCDSNPVGYLCKLRYPSSGTDSFTGINRFTINLNSGNKIDSKGGIFYVDVIKPTVTINTKNDLISEGDIEFDYSIEDKACNDPSCSGKCSGISKIEFFTSDNRFKETVDINTPSCSKTDVLIKPTSIFGDGEHAVFAKAFDRLGNPSDVVSAIFKIDSTPPLILTSTFKITDSSDFEINYISSKNTDVIGKVDIKADDLKLDSVFGDFSELGSGQTNEQATCTQSEDDLYTCSWNKLKINTEEAGTKNFKIEASDLAGNKAEVTIPITFDLDNLGPEVISLKSSRTLDEKNYVKPTENEFIAEFKEDGVGIKAEDAILHLEGNEFPATECSPSWICTWEEVDVSGSGKVTVSIQSDTKDRLGNALLETFSIEAIVDNKGPRDIEIEITSIGGSQQAIENIIKTGDSLFIIANVTDEGIESASVDLSEFIQGADDLIADNCQNIEDDKWQCTWTTNPIDIEGFIDGNIIFTFTDVAGNSVIHRVKINAFGVIKDLSPEFWEHEVSCSPKLIDRETASLKNQKIFCHVTLDPLENNNEVETLVIDIDKCFGDSDALSESPELFNAEAGSRNPVIKLSLVQTEFNVNNLTLECPLSIISKVGNEITKVPEEELVNIKIEFYNLPLGELTDNVQKKVDDSVDFATNGVFNTIGTLKTIENYATRLCKLGSLIAGIPVILKGIGFTLGLITEGSKGTPWYAPLRGARMGVDGTNDGSFQGAKRIYKAFKEFCSFVNCDLTYGTSGKFTGWMGETQNLGEDIFESLDVGEVVSKYVGRGGEIAHPSTYMNPKDSLVVSVLTVCIPGIIHNLDKFRQIQCMYASCLQTGVSQQGLPVMACEDQKGYATCKYVVGEIFNLIPIAVVFDQYLSKIRDIISNPLELIGLVPSAICRSSIASIGDLEYHFCSFSKMAALLGQTLRSLAGMGDVVSLFQEFKLRDDFCERLEKPEDN